MFNKRLLSICMSIVLAIGLMPLPAFADESAPSDSDLDNAAFAVQADDLDNEDTDADDEGYDENDETDEADDGEDGDYSDEADDEADGDEGNDDEADGDEGDDEDEGGYEEDDGESGPLDIYDEADVWFEQDKYVWTGKEITPKPIVTVYDESLDDDVPLTEGVHYQIRGYKNNKNVGEATIIIVGIEEGGYIGETEDYFDIVPAAPTITAKTLSKTVKAKKAKKKALSFKMGATVNSGAKLTYKAKNTGKITFKNGTATLKKGTKKGTYSIKVTVSCPAKGNYAKGSKDFVLKFTVKK